MAGETITLGDLYKTRQMMEWPLQLCLKTKKKWRRLESRKKLHASGVRKLGITSGPLWFIQ